jgi:hypothetical protein
MQDARLLVECIKACCGRLCLDVFVGYLFFLSYSFFLFMPWVMMDDGAQLTISKGHGCSKD